MFIGLHQKFYFGAPTILFDCLKAALFRDHTVIATLFRDHTVIATLFRDHTVIATLFRNHTIIGPLVQKLHSHGINSCGVVLDKLSEILHGHYHEIVSCTVEPHCVEVK
jgi:hypothetical protein